MTNPPLSLILAATVGAGAMFILTVQPLPQSACEPVELVRFVDSKPEIHIIEANSFGVSQDAWLQQFDAGEPVVAQEEDEPVRHPHRWRRHGR